MLKPSLEEAFPVQDQNVAKDYIGKRGSTEGITKDKRIRYASEILQKVRSSSSFSSTSFSFFVGNVASCSNWRVL